MRYLIQEHVARVPMGQLYPGGDWSKTVYFKDLSFASVFKCPPPSLHEEGTAREGF